MRRSLNCAPETLFWGGRHPTSELRSLRREAGRQEVRSWLDFAEIHGHTVRGVARQPLAKLVLFADPVLREQLINYLI